MQEDIKQDEIIPHHKSRRAISRIYHAFGDEWFGLKAEAFARFFGTPVFLVGQTILVFFWVFLNIIGFVKFDPYPFILLNLAFSLQAAYAAPLILLAQTRQAERDGVQAASDAKHREEVNLAIENRQITSEQNTEKLLQLLEQNTQLTAITKQMAEHIEMLTMQLHTLSK